MIFQLFLKEELPQILSGAFGKKGCGGTSCPPITFTLKKCTRTFNFQSNDPTPKLM